MATKSQHTPAYERLRSLLRALREGAGLAQRDLGQRLGKPQSWVHNCETGNRRVDVAEFAAWAKACDVDAQAAFKRFLELDEPAQGAAQPHADTRPRAGRPSRRARGS